MEESNFKTRLKREGGGVGQERLMMERERKSEREREKLPNKYFKLQLVENVFEYILEGTGCGCVSEVAPYPIVPRGFLFLLLQM